MRGDREQPKGRVPAEAPLRERLVGVGVDLVLEGGVEALGLREIARRAGVSHGAPRRWFPTHRSLLSAIARSGFTDLAERLERAAPQDSPASAREQIDALARAYLAYARERRGMFELMFRHELLEGGAQAPADHGTASPSGQTEGVARPAALPPLRETSLPLLWRLASLVARHRAERGLPGAPVPEVAAVALWSNLHGLAQLQGWGSLDPALGAGPGGNGEEARLLTAVLDAHLAGPA
ncbi:TetR/AcrR family transcriptional regulator [Streptomyces sp. NPDC049954]|uniref:TetR/AcrR family transcriptional regulator n=1 Tax=Streptomyces sp. NPDC049954 TaxID=3155779 RepID=UPI00341C20EA